MVHGGWRGDSCTRAQGSPHFIESAHTGQRTRAPTKRMSQELCTRDLGGNWWWSHRPTFCRQAPPSNLAKRITVHRIAPPLLVLSREKGQMVHRPQSAPSSRRGSAGQVLKVPQAHLSAEGMRQGAPQEICERMLCAIIEIGNAESPRPNHQFSLRGPHFWCTIAEWWWDGGTTFLSHRDSLCTPNLAKSKRCGDPNYLNQDVHMGALQRGLCAGILVVSVFLNLAKLAKSRKGEKDCVRGCSLLLVVLSISILANYRE